MTEGFSKQPRQLTRDDFLPPAEYLPVRRERRRRLSELKRRRQVEIGPFAIFHFENFETAVKIGKPVARLALKNATRFVSSECPLAGMHIVQGMEIEAGTEVLPQRQLHPIELVARAYGIPGDWLGEEARNR